MIRRLSPAFGREKTLKIGLRWDCSSSPEAQIAQQQRASIREALSTYLRSRGWLAGESAEPLAILRAWLSQLASGNAYLVLLNLEDLWLEPLPQNVPGTWEERPNWKRKARFSLDEICKMNSVTEILKAIDEIRKRLPLILTIFTATDQCKSLLASLFQRG